jgi:hypothetical protein
MNTITWTPEMLKRFKDAYERAINGGNDSFMFDGNEFVTPYAGYLIEYLEIEFKRHAAMHVDWRGKWTTRE